MSNAFLTFAVLVSLVGGAVLYLTAALLWPLLARFGRLPLVLASCVGLALLAACVVPPAHYSDSHAQWLEHVKRSGF